MRGSSSNPLRLVLLGAPGAGKGTQAQLLCLRLGIPHISTGDILRQNQQAGTVLGQMATSYIDRGELVPDRVISAVVEDQLKTPEASTGFALDGFPRTLPQAEMLEEIFGRVGVGLTAVLYYDCPVDELVRRLSSRLVCENCKRVFHFPDPELMVGVQCGACGGNLVRREDDAPETVRRRLELYFERTRPLVDYYNQRHLLAHVDALGEVEEIYGRALEALHTVQQNVQQTIQPAAQQGAQYTAQQTVQRSAPASAPPGVQPSVQPAREGEPGAAR